MQKKNRYRVPAIAGAGCRWQSLCFYKSGGSTGDICVQSLGVETMRLSHGDASAPSDALSLQVFLSGSFRHSPSISVSVVFRPFLSKKWDRVVHKSTFSVACPVASDLSAIRFYPNFCAERRKNRTSYDIRSRELVEVTGFEPATFWSRTKRATKLRYTSSWSQ